MKILARGAPHKLGTNPYRLKKNYQLPLFGNGDVGDKISDREVLGPCGTGEKQAGQTP